MCSHPSFLLLLFPLARHNTQQQQQQQQKRIPPLLGFLYSFLGLSCLQEAYSERVNDVVEHSDERFHVSWLPLFMQVSSWMMAALGAVYMILGLCCMKVIRDRMTKEHRERMETYREAMKIYKENL